MGREIVDVSLVEIDHPDQGHVNLTTVKTFEVTDSDGKKPVATMNPKRRAIGVQRGVPEFKWQMELFIPAGVAPEFDFRAAKNSRTFFAIPYEENDGGLRHQVVDCWVDDVERKYDVEGNAMESVKGGALDFIDE